MKTADGTTAGLSLRFGGLAAEDWGRDDHRAPLLLLHGMTFDKTIWRGIAAELQRVDPGRRVLALDLPGHGESPDQRSYDLLPVAEGVHAAAEQAGLHAPVVVGHSAAAGIASVYAARFPARGVVNIDSSPVMAPIASFIRSIAEQLRGPEFGALWQIFYDSFHVELLPPDAQEIVRSTCRPRQEIALGYWRALMDDPIEQLTGMIEQTSARIAAAKIPYLYLAGADLDPDTQMWMDRQPFNPTVEVWRDTGHFPHLAHPTRFAERLVEFSTA